MPECLKCKKRAAENKRDLQEVLNMERLIARVKAASCLMERQGIKMYYKYPAGLGKRKHETDQLLINRLRERFCLPEKCVSDDELLKLTKGTFNRGAVELRLALEDLGYEIIEGLRPLFRFILGLYPGWKKSIKAARGCSQLEDEMIRLFPQQNREKKMPEEITILEGDQVTRCGMTPAQLDSAIRFYDGAKRILETDDPLYKIYVEQIEFLCRTQRVQESFGFVVDKKGGEKET